MGAREPGNYSSREINKGCSPALREHWKPSDTVHCREEQRLTTVGQTGLSPVGTAGQVTPSPSSGHTVSSLMSPWRIHPGLFTALITRVLPGSLRSFPFSWMPQKGCSISTPGWAPMAQPGRDGERTVPGAWQRAASEPELPRPFVLCPVYPAERNRGVQCAGISRPRPAPPPHESC